MVLTHAAFQLFLESSSLLKYDLLYASDTDDESDLSENDETITQIPVIKERIVQRKATKRKHLGESEIAKEQKDVVTTSIKVEPETSQDEYNQIKICHVQSISSELNRIYLNCRNDPEKFYEYTRLSFETFDFILKQAEKFMATRICKTKKALTSAEKLFVTLGYLSNSVSSGSLTSSVGIGKSSIFNFIYRTLNAIWLAFSQKYLPRPTREMFDRISEDFHSKWQFPNCVGSIEEKHFRSTKRMSQSSEEKKTKKFYTLVLQAISDADYKFVTIEVGPNKEGGTFYSSKLNNLLKNNEYNLPQMKKLPESDTKVPYVFLGDQMYPLKSYLMRPYTKILENNMEVFNSRLKRARTIEGAFNILSNKWRILMKPLEVGPKNAKLIVKVVCLLHNIVRERDGDADKDFEEFVNKKATGKKKKSKRNNRASSRAITVRDQFKDYFVSHILSE